MTGTGERETGTQKERVCLPLALSELPCPSARPHSLAPLSGRPAHTHRAEAAQGREAAESEPRKVWTGQQGEQSTDLTRG